MLVRCDAQVTLQECEFAFGESSPLGPAIVVVMDGGLQLSGDPSKASRDDGLWRVSAFGDLAADAKLKAGDVFAIGQPG